MGRFGPEVQDILELYGDAYLESHAVTPQQRRVVADLRSCRTAALGGHAHECPECGYREVSYNSCRNRHCPKCQGTAREVWLIRRECELVDCPHYHVVFTVPQELNPIFLRNQAPMYNLLFRCSWETVREFAADRRHLGGETGSLSVLHTWTQVLDYHPHVHMVVPAGALTPRGSWRHGSRKFFAPVRGMGKAFRAKVVAGVRRMARAGELDLGGCASHLAGPGELDRALDGLFAKPWVVYCERPFGGAANVLKYLARYTHRVAIANSRIRSVEGGRVTFAWRDSREGRRREKEMTLDAMEFIRRFLMHVLPERFSKIRYYGVYACRGKSGKLARCRRATRTSPSPLEGLGYEELADIARERLLGRRPDTCPKCGAPMKTRELLL